MSAPGYETRDFRARHALIFIGVCLAACVITAAIVWGVGDSMRSSAIADHGSARHPLAQARIEPPAPRLQLIPSKEIGSYRAESQRRLSTYGWVQRDAGVVRLPVERAKELVLKEGLPARGAP